jgi:hypothetical protein
MTSEITCVGSFSTFVAKPGAAEKARENERNEAAERTAQYPRMRGDAKLEATEVNVCKVV